MEALIRERVESGRYTDDAAVLDEALRLLEERDRLEYLRALVDEADAAIARGEVIEWTPDFMDRLSREADEANRDGVPVDDHVLP
jgi:putative addiction module CopG family antidote